MNGKKVWFFPDGDRPPFGESELKGHESYIVLIPNREERILYSHSILRMHNLSGIFG